MWTGGGLADEQWLSVCFYYVVISIGGATVMRQNQSNPIWSLHKYYVILCMQILSWKILIIVDNVYEGLSVSFASRLSLILIATFLPHTAGLHQAIVSIYWIRLFVPLWLLVIGVTRTSLMVGGFRSKELLVLLEEETDPSVVRCGNRGINSLSK